MAMIDVRRQMLWTLLQPPLLEREKAHAAEGILPTSDGQTEQALSLW